jgi:hypothetical protein
MRHPLDEKYLKVRHFLATNLFGDDSFECEVDGFVRGASSREVVISRISDMRRLLADPSVDDDDLDSFVLAHATWFIDQSGRRTIERVAERLRWALDHHRLPTPSPCGRPAWSACSKSTPAAAVISTPWYGREPLRWVRMRQGRPLAKPPRCSPIRTSASRSSRSLCAPTPGGW